jgi:hypothetical protein
VLKIEESESESELLCTDSTALLATLLLMFPSLASMERFNCKTGQVGAWVT